jgi:aryl-alcohol dehydrogenase-like predicted oxidoreductase
MMKRERAALREMLPGGGGWGRLRAGPGWALVRAGGRAPGRAATPDPQPHAIPNPVRSPTPRDPQPHAIPNPALVSSLSRMEERSLGTQGLVVSAEGLGCMGMSEFYGAADESEAIATIHRALDLGITMLDTADMYGPFTNEQLVGQAVADRRDQVVLATKFGIVRDPNDPTKRGFNGRPEYVRSSCEGSLRRLAVDHIDLYYQHRVDPDVPIEETVGAMAELVDEGKVRFLGLSEAGAATIRRANDVHPISAVQSEYSLWSRDIEDEVIPATRELGVGLVAYSPLGRGFLTGRFTSESDFGEGDFRRSQPRFQGDNLARNLELVDRVREIAGEHQCTPGQLALAWVLHRGPDVVPIPGTKRRAYLDENVAATELSLSDDDLQRIEELADSTEIAGDRYSDMSFINR